MVLLQFSQRNALQRSTCIIGRARQHRHRSSKPVTRTRQT
jgi:hypothetical protein